MRASPSSPFADRLKRLRQELMRQGLHACIVPRADEFQNEYVPACAERLSWISGFTGSAGLAVISLDKAAVFVDGRYTLQARNEVPSTLFEYRDLNDATLAEWFKTVLSSGQRAGYDPWLHTHQWVKNTRPLVEKAGATLVSCAANPVDAVWVDRPAPPVAPIIPHPLEYAGRSAEDKRTERGSFLTRERLDAAVMVQPDCIAWLLNVRGDDLPHTPFPLSFAMLHHTGEVDWFVDERKLTPNTRQHIGNAVRLHPVNAFVPALTALGQQKKRVRIDPHAAPSCVVEELKKAGAVLDFGLDPCMLPKACKNDTEINGARAAHVRDGVALTRFLHWLSVEGTKGTVTEISAADKLLSFRKESPLLRDLSFDTIAGDGSNAAIIHYHSQEKTNHPLEMNTLFLVDSGGQYPDGTTDVTRTVVIGTPSAEMRDRYTRVLKGHIALSTARFPQGTTGSQLDPLARRPLWDVGLDYDHGTGHGVGSYLSVHEGPQRISKNPNTVALQPGMIVSNEPGYYKAGAWGIRLESLITVLPCQSLHNTERPLLEFETLTLAPFDPTLIDTPLLSQEELAWLNAYHRTVRETLTPLLPADTAAWLAKVTREISD